jgi:hypothetical protein
LAILRVHDVVLYSAFISRPDSVFHPFAFRVKGQERPGLSFKLPRARFLVGFQQSAVAD